MIPTHLLKYLQFYLKNFVLKALVPRHFFIRLRKDNASLRILVTRYLKHFVLKALVLKALLLILQRLKRDEVSLQIARAGGTTQSKVLKTPCD
jgi:hypothetical protein